METIKGFIYLFLIILGTIFFAPSFGWGYSFVGSFLFVIVGIPIIQTLIESPDVKLPNIKFPSGENLEKDFWEGTLFQDYDYKELKGEFFIEYKDPNNLETKRDFSMNTFYYADDQKDYFIQGRCHLRKQNRTFRVSRIQKIINKETGEFAKNKDCEKFLNDIYQNSPFFIYEKVFNDHSSDINCLMYVARLDGRFTKKEKEAIVNYLEEINPPTFTEEIKDLMFKYLGQWEDVSQTKLKKEIQKVKKSGRNINILCDTVNNIVKTTKTKNPVAVAGSEMVVKLLKK